MQLFGCEKFFLVFSVCCGPFPSCDPDCNLVYIGSCQFTGNLPPGSIPVDKRIASIHEAALLGVLIQTG